MQLAFEESHSSVPKDKRHVQTSSTPGQRLTSLGSILTLKHA